MRKVYKLENLGCANCAAKMENAIRKIEGVKDASISFITQRLTIEADEDRFDDIIEKAQNVCRKIEYDCRIVG